VVERLGRLLDQAWQLKRRFSDVLSNDHINALYAHGLAHGAIGGKLCGAGGGGFLLFIVPPGQRLRFTAAFEPNSIVKIDCDWQGSRPFGDRQASS
jgi:D-glycero-alpha-D-manno-heptose-7-phosphate kinase